MRRGAYTVSWLLAILPVQLSAQSTLPGDTTEIVQAALITTAEDFIAPSFKAQATAASELAENLDAYCEGTGEIILVHHAFAETFLAWQRASLIQFGPVAEAEGALRFQLWPDPKGFAARAVQAAIAAEDPALLESGGLSGRSVALSNLTALEILIYDDLPPRTYACALAVSIGDHQAQLAMQLSESWHAGSPFRAAYDSAATGNDTFNDVTDLLRVFLAGTVVYADRLRKFKLLRGLGDAPGAARPERTEAVASGLGLRSIEASFRALADLYDVPLGLFDSAPEVGGSMEYLVLADQAASVADSLAFETQSLAEVAEADGDRAAELRRYADLVLYHESYLKNGFLNSLGLVSGFTAADGD